MVECSEAGHRGIVALGLVPVVLAFGDLEGKAVAYTSTVVFCNSWSRDFLAGGPQTVLVADNFHWKHLRVPCHNSSGSQSTRAFRSIPCHRVADR
jgi:hypothetical protein